MCFDNRKENWGNSVDIQLGVSFQNHNFQCSSYFIKCIYNFFGRRQSRLLYFLSLSELRILQKDISINPQHRVKAVLRVLFKTDTTPPVWEAGHPQAQNAGASVVGWGWGTSSSQLSCSAVLRTKRAHPHSKNQSSRSTPAFVPKVTVP